MLVFFIAEKNLDDWKVLLELLKDCRQIKTKVTPLRNLNLFLKL